MIGVCENEIELLNIKLGTVKAKAVKNSRSFCCMFQIKAWTTNCIIQIGFILSYGKSYPRDKWIPENIALILRYTYMAF